MRAELTLGNCGPQTAGFFHLHRDHVDWVFVDNPVYHRPGADPLPFAARASFVSARPSESAAVISDVAEWVRLSGVWLLSPPLPLVHLSHFFSA